MNVEVPIQICNLLLDSLQEYIFTIYLNFLQVIFSFQLSLF